MIVALLISNDQTLIARVRSVAAERAVVLQAASAETAGRIRGGLPDVVLYDAGSSLASAPIETINTVAPGRPVFVLSTRRDPLAEAAWLRSGARAVLHPGAEEDLAHAFAPHGLLPAQAHGAFPNGVVSPLPRVEQRCPAHPAPAWEAAMRCLARSWRVGGDPAVAARLGVELCREGIGASRCAVLLSDGQGGLVLAAGENIPEDFRAAYLPAHGAALAEQLESLPRLFRPSDSPAAAARVVALFGASVCVPLLGDTGIEGALLAAPPASGGDYAPEHEDYLLVLARLLGRALSEVRAQARTQVTQTRYDHALNDAPVGLLCLDPELKVEAINREAESLLAIPRDEAAGRHIQQVHSQLCDAAMRARAGETIESPLVIRRPGSGGGIEARINMRADGRAVFSLAAMPEASVNRDLDASSQLWESIALRLAQEIKNPLVAINTFAQLLPRKYNSEEFRAAFGKVVQEEIERINGVVDTLYQFAAEPQLKLQRLDVNTTVREVVDAFARSVAERGIEVESRLEEESLSAVIDPAAFRVVMEQLMRNAADAMPAGGRVSVTAQAADKGVEIRVEDSGGGIAREHAAKVFDPFYSSKERGAGLGLTIARKLAEAHSGSLELESPEGGTRFLLRFPNLAVSGQGAPLADDPRN